METNENSEKLDYFACVERAVDAFAMAEAATDPHAKAEYLKIAELWKETADLMRKHGLGNCPVG